MRQVMDLCWISAGKTRHRLDAFPIGDSHELGLPIAILAERLDTKSLLDERFDPGLKAVLLVFISPLTFYAPLQIRAIDGLGLISEGV